jgi:hypothetical protein
MDYFLKILRFGFSGGVAIAVAQTMAPDLLLAYSCRTPYSMKVCLISSANRKNSSVSISL